MAATTMQPQIWDGRAATVSIVEATGIAGMTPRAAAGASMVTGSSGVSGGRIVRMGGRAGERAQPSGETGAVTIAVIAAETSGRLVRLSSAKTVMEAATEETAIVIRAAEIAAWTGKIAEQANAAETSGRNQKGINTIVQRIAKCPSAVSMTTSVKLCLGCGGRVGLYVLLNEVSRLLQTCVLAV